ncbi:1-deoxy-D-xylulose-5-phosphate reductoisomerase [Brevibacterium sp. BRM-1]|uniref:1-deoxy-D-xylulose-5-phosphate reductoisomerase n=1 Tax=Brevibacterium sp. BRM-1 TaxID=2999062 RepID=UPI00227DF33B|nr:1-deoxy-D-xylulose-5-phosphate reductoisomerase [Brevibacterium sp. BRM-1]WAL41264.1 1-deoxy-D-xylulose-5-phosphate reductoisomerase [Brevibacterium sp. BRM-1]
MDVRDLSVLGATGSVGRQALDVARRNPGRFRVRGLAAGSDAAGLAALAVEFGVEAIALAVGSREVARAALARAAAAQGVPDPVREILVGPDAAAQLAARPADIVLNAVTGAVGLGATLAALDAGTDVALANKESLIIGGELVLAAARATGARLLPVDSEHSALWQCLRAGARGEVDRLVITASGGPFRGMDRAQLEAVTPAQALAHPTWDMGAVITTNSATLVNKGLEVIEAHLLFGIAYGDIDVVVHPQSQIHSMVQFRDGATIAQVSPPDMRLPIAYALGLEERIPGAAPANDWSAAQEWTFEAVDHAAFPALGLAIAAGRRGGTAPAAYNAANEVLVEAFHAGAVSFPQIADGLAAVLAQHADAEATRASVLAADASARAAAAAWARTADENGRGAA